MKALETHSVVKRFGQVTALNGVSMSVAPGEIVALLGPNGAGKTTLIDICLGLQSATDGSASLYGMTPHQAIKRSLVGVVQQTGALNPDVTVRQMLALIAAMHVTSLPVDDVLARTNLTDFASTKIRKLSGGEQQRVRLALALLPDPLLLILDEPTTGMDPINRRLFWEVMDKECARGRTIIFATHYLTEAQEFAQRTIIMRQGSIIADGPTADIQELAGGTVVSANVRRTDSLEATLREAGYSDVTWGPITNGNGNSAPHDLVGDEANLSILTRTSDPLARLLLDAGAYSLRIIPRSLDEAYIALVEGTQEADSMLGPASASPASASPASASPASVRPTTVA